MNNLFEDKKFGIIISLIAIIIYYLIKHFIYNVNTSTIAFSKTWLEMSLLFTFIAVTLIFVNLLIIVIKGINEDLTKNLSDEESKSIKCGIFLGFGACLLLFGIIILSFLNIINSLILQLLTIGFAIVAFYIDRRFQCKLEMLKFDKVIIIGLIITFVLSLCFNNFNILNFENKEHFICGFTAGATAFQVFIAGLYFDTKEYSKKEVFKLE